MRQKQINHKTIMEEGRKLEQYVYRLFLEAGWKAKFGDNRRAFDIALFTQDDRLVGAVETKLDYNHRRMQFQRERAFRVLTEEGIEFYILFCNETAYIYTLRGFIRLKDIPTPSNYQTMLDGETVKMWEAFNRPQVDAEDTVSPQVKKLEDMIKSLSKQMSDGHEEIMRGHEKINEKLDRISEQIQALSDKISDYQELIERQLKNAESENEAEKIISAFSEEVVSKIQHSFNENYEMEEYEREEEYLKSLFGVAWEKVSEQSKKYLISAQLMYKKQIGYGDLLDYSGVCLLVTKALETEMAKRFYTDYIVYLRNRFGSSETNLNNWPYTFVKRIQDEDDRWIKSVLPEHSFTLGSVAFALCYRFARRENEAKRENDLSTIIDYANSELFEVEKSFDDAKTVVHDIAKEVEYIRENYRNPSAHKNALLKDSAEECINYVISVQKVMIKILDYLKY